ncbi:flagellar hook-length control protein FliK [Modestobacter sp. VKM Ac-2984]|uniref:flagellar hook-length control protein FliK n=1 Tax=Modestobacter sp. VKM Ac-2984 TaxID=3004138 RepID=UPI0022AA8372|nr:flagellar hook-length control protein FliK [Modestobacter sp. VKM Ac-2984]MCZ2817820.1 flagellar hook-length control protein FliK [Modestobacter sp. VKM Ac-2984]
MSSPTTLPVTSAPARSGAAAHGATGRSAAGDRAPAFASALDDALGSERAPSRASQRAADRATERAADRSAVRSPDRSPAGRPDRPADAPADRVDPPTADPAAKATDGGTEAAAPPVPLQPGLWALLAAAAPLTAESTAGLGTTAAAAGLIGAVTGAGQSADGSATLPGVPAAAVPASATAPATPVPAPPPAAPLLPAPAVPAAAVPAAVDATAALAEAAGLTLVVDPAGAPATLPATGPVPAGAPGADPAATTDTVGTPLLLPPSGDAADTAGTGSGSAGDDPAPAAPGSAASTGEADGVFGLPGPTPTVAPAAATGAAVPAPAEPPVAAQLGRQLAVLHNALDGSQTMTVVLTPDDLGPVSVQVTITRGVLDVTLHGAHEAGRQALLDALPDLRRELDSAGLTAGRVEVGADGGDAGTGARTAQQLFDAQTGQHGRSGRPEQQGGSPSDGQTADPLGRGSTAPAADQSTSAGVDVRV